MDDISSVRENEIATLYIGEKLDYLNADKLTSNILLINGISKILFDFTKVQLIDSTGIMELLQIIKNLKSMNIEVKIINIQPMVYEIFKILGISKVLGRNNLYLYRRFFRAPLQTLLYIENNENNLKSTGETLNVSLGGCAFQTNANFDVGEEVSLSISMSNDLLKVIGLIRWKISIDELKTYGIEFIILDELSKEIISSYVHTINEK